MQIFINNFSKKNQKIRKIKTKYNLIPIYILIFVLILVVIYGFKKISYQDKLMGKIMIEIKDYNQHINLLNNSNNDSNSFNFISYSQEFEDLILYSIFYDVKNGFYIDVGANDPDDCSVTKAFYNLGWNGINIEPLPDKFKKLEEERKRDINLNIAAGDKKGYSKLNVGGACSKIVGNSRSYNAINVTIETMATICQQYIPLKKEIHFCKIDVELYEKNVLLGYDFENYRPKVFCIESVYPGTTIPCYQLWEYILFEHDYSLAYDYKINRYYIDNRIPYLKERFNNTHIFINNYKKNMKK